MLENQNRFLVDRLNQLGQKSVCNMEDKQANELTVYMLVNAGFQYLYLN